MKYQKGFTKFSVIISILILIVLGFFALTAYKYKQNMDPSRESIGVLKEDPVTIPVVQGL